MRLALTGCSWCYDDGFVFKQLCSALQGGQRLRCKLTRLKRAGELDETGSDWILLVLCGKGFVLQWVRVQSLGDWCWCWMVIKHLCSFQKAPEMQTGQAEKSRRTL